MFINEYLMDHKRYEKWTVPIFYKLPIFYFYVFVFILGVVGYCLFIKYNLNMRWQTVSILLIFIAIYRGFCVNWMKANKMYRLMKQQYFGGKPWLTRVEIDDKFIAIYVNDKINNDVHWDKIIKCAVAKSYISLKTEKQGESVMLDKDCFIKGDTESFLAYMKTHHQNIPIVDEDPRLNK